LEFEAVNNRLKKWTRAELIDLINKYGEAK
jgi:hypothetical protein